MKKVFICFLLLNFKLIVAQNIVSDNSKFNPFISDTHGKQEEAIFRKIKLDNKIFKINLSPPNYYPINNGDFWEFLEFDTTTLLGVKLLLKFSVTKVIVGDTLMPNGLMYKVIKCENCANSIRKSPQYEFQRKDSLNKIYIYYNNKDNLLFDFSLNVGTIYPSHYPGLFWQVDRKYLVVGFGDTLSAIDLSLNDTNDTKYYTTIIENFGITYYKTNNDGSNNTPEGNFFGGIINNSTYGYILSKRQQIDWSEFYPLHVGDFWKYQGKNGSIQTISTVKVVSDTLINGYTFKKLLSIDHTFNYISTAYERMENNIVYSWHSWDSSITMLYKFSACLGDTISDNNAGNIFWRVNDKNFSTIQIFSYPDISSYRKYFTRGLGLTGETIEFNSSNLVGAVINGQVLGDTTITNLMDEEQDLELKNDFVLYQNFPNPFNSSTIIKYAIKKYSHVCIKIFDLLGREIQTLVNEQKSAGEYQTIFNAANLSSGVYVYILRSEGYSTSRKLIMLK